MAAEIRVQLVVRRNPGRSMLRPIRLGLRLVDRAGRMHRWRIDGDQPERAIPTIEELCRLPA
jgi:hypothetical protein